MGPSKHVLGSTEPRQTCTGLNLAQANRYSFQVSTSSPLQKPILVVQKGSAFIGRALLGPSKDVLGSSGPRQTCTGLNLAQANRYSSQRSPGPSYQKPPKGHPRTSKQHPKNLPEASLESKHLQGSQKVLKSFHQLPTGGQQARQPGKNTRKAVKQASRQTSQADD